MYEKKISGKVLKISRPALIEEGEDVHVGLFAGSGNGYPVVDLKPFAYVNTIEDYRRKLVVDSEELKLISLPKDWHGTRFGAFYGGRLNGTGQLPLGLYEVVILDTADEDITLQFDIVSPTNLLKEANIHTIESSIRLVEKYSSDRELKPLSGVCENALKQVEQWISWYGTGCFVSRKANLDSDSLSNLKVREEPLRGVLESILYRGAKSLKYIGDISLSCLPVIEPDERVSLAVGVNVYSPISDGVRPPTLESEAFFKPLSPYIEFETANIAKFSYFLNVDLVGP